MKTIISIGIALLVLRPMILRAQQFLGEDLPTSGAKLFAPSIISTWLNERDFAISPDGTEVYYSTVLNRDKAMIVSRKYENGTWSAPKVLPFSGSSYDIEPALSPDGSKLYFASKRNGDFDIFVSTKAPDGGWSQASKLGGVVNTSADEFFPSVTEDGTLYWTANYSEGKGGEDIWFAKLEDGQYITREVLPSAINTARDEFNAYVGPKGDYILFSSFGREDATGGGDLYMSRRFADGQWSSAYILPTPINSAKLDYCPYVSPDGRFLFYTSEVDVANDNRSANLFDTAGILKGLLSPDKQSGGNIYWTWFTF